MSSLISLFCLLVLAVVSTKKPSARDQTRIVGGTESAEGKWPFFAGLFYKLRDDPNVPHCGAVVWDKDTLITAAHCVLNDNLDPNHPELISAYMGYNNWTAPKHEEYMFKAREIITHPDYNKSSLSNDVALIFLDRSIDFDDINRKVRCVCDPEPLELLNTSACVIMGWGRDNENNKPTNLMEVALPILEDHICSAFSKYYNPNDQLCAGSIGPWLPSGTCIGDSGGPLVCAQLAQSSKYSLVGISIFGGFPPKCGKSPSYFTNVDFHLKWISRVHPKTSNVQTPPKMSWWDNFWLRWFGTSNHKTLRK